MNVKQKQVQQAIKALSAAGLRFKVIDEDGTEHGNLPVLVEQPKVQRPKRIVRRNVFARSGYIGTLGKMAVGDVESIAPPSGATADEMRGAVSGTCTRLFGRGNYATSINDGHVEVFRLA